MLIMDAYICTDLYSIWNLVGWALMVFKIVIPLLIIIFGMIDLGRAVVASKDDEIKKSITKLAVRAIAGIFIFFIPTIVSAIFKMIDGFQDDAIQGEYSVCSECLAHPGEKCKTAASTQCGTYGGTWSDDSGCLSTSSN